MPHKDAGKDLLTRPPQNASDEFSQIPPESPVIAAQAA